MDWKLIYLYKKIPISKTMLFPLEEEKKKEVT